MTLKERYKSQFIYVTPGSGKTTLAKDYKVFYDSDDLMIEVIKDIHPEFPLINDQTVQEYIHEFVKKYKYKTKINKLALKRAKSLNQDGFTVLTGTLKLAKDADYVFVMKPENPRIISRFKNIIESTKFYELQINYFNENNIPFHILNMNLEDELFVKKSSST
jgi:hypothetical protein